MSWVLLYNSDTAGRYNGFCHGYLYGASHFISFVMVTNDIMMIIIHHVFFYDRELARRRKMGKNPETIPTLLRDCHGTRSCEEEDRQLPGNQINDRQSIPDRGGSTIQPYFSFYHLPFCRFSSNDPK